MTSLSNLQYSKEKQTIAFKINNTKKESTYEVSLINGLRRIIIANVNSYSIDRDSVIFINNNTIFNSDYLSQRLNLIPLNFKVLNNLDTDNIKIDLKKENLDNKTIDVFAKDFQIFENDKLIESNKIFPHPDIIFCKLKENNSINLTCKVKKSSLKEDNSSHSVVSKAVHYFEEDPNELKELMQKSKKNGKINDFINEKNFILANKERCYKKTNDNKPLIYCFEIDGVGDIEVKDIFTIACDYLVKKMEDINIDLGNLNDDKIEIKKSETNILAFDFIFFNEDDTLGNLLQSHLFKDSSVDYVAYSIPHPLDNKLLLRLSLKKESDKTNMKKNLESIINSIKLIIKNTKKLKSDYLSLLK